VLPKGWSVQKDSLTTQNLYLRKLLDQAGFDAAARDVAEQIQKVLTDEIHHRMKNMLGMVTAIVRQSMRSAASLAEAEAAIATRLVAMANAHDLLLKADWKAAGLTSIILGAVEQHNTATGRLTIQGDEMEIASSSILCLTLIINELCTNATKYGAFSKEGGQVTLSWTQDEADKSIIFKWVESGGPTVGPPDRRSFGTRLIEEALPRQLGGRGRLSFPPSGVQYELIVPLDNLKPAAFV
jgi:two-component sensor histidine kinase